MKKILMLMVMAIMAVTMNAQVINYRATGFYSSVKNAYGWTAWDGPRQSSVSIVINWDEDIIVIKSKYSQLYKVTYAERGMTNDGEQTIEAKAIDKDGDTCYIRLMVRNSGNSQIYVIYNDARWCYDVVRY